MPRYSDEPLDDNEYPDDEDLREDREDEVITPCPQCGSPVYEDAQQCPHCHTWLPDELERWRPQERWFYRTGRWMMRLLAVNWLVWVILGLISMLVVAFTWMRR